MLTKEINYIHIILLLITAIFISHLPTLIWPIVSIDEADFAVQTAVWLKKGIPYIDFVEKKPIIIHMLYLLAFKIGGLWNMASVHIIFALTSILSGLFIFKTIKKLINTKTALIALSLFAVYHVGYDINDFLAAATEEPLNLFSILTVYFFIDHLLNGKSYKNLFIASIFSCIAVLSKHVGISLFIAMTLTLILKRFYKRESKLLFYDALIIILGVAIPALLFTLYLYSQNALDAAVYWAWFENFRYASNPIATKIIILHALERTTIYMLASLPLWLLSISNVFIKIKNRTLSFLDMFLILWLVLSFATLSIGGKFFPHYFLQLVPPLIYLSAFGWQNFAPKIQKYKNINLVLVIIVMIIPYILFLTLHIAEARNLANKYQIEYSIGKKITSLTKEDDKIFVWGHNSDIYFYAKRLPASRFIYCALLTPIVEGFEKHNVKRSTNDYAWDLLMADLKKNMPQIIVDMSPTSIRSYDRYPPTSFPVLYSFIKDNYKQQYTVNNAKIYINKYADQ